MLLFKNNCPIKTAFKIRQHIFSKPPQLFVHWWIQLFFSPCVNLKSRKEEEKSVKMGQESTLERRKKQWSSRGKRIVTSQVKIQVLRVAMPFPCDGNCSRVLMLPLPSMVQLALSFMLSCKPECRICAHLLCSHICYGGAGILLHSSQLFSQHLSYLATSWRCPHLQDSFSIVSVKFVRVTGICFY